MQRRRAALATRFTWCLLALLPPACASKKPRPPQVPLTAYAEIPEDERWTGVDEPVSPTAAPKKKVCGRERWDVKTLTDDNVGDVNFTPVASTVRKLAGVHPRCEGGLDDPRSGVHESRVYEVEATIREVKKEADRDLHIILEDDDGWTMVAELVDPKCPGTRDGDHVAMLKTVHDAYYDRLASGDLDGQRVHVRGVGFFDRWHGQSGMAESCLELHPIIHLEPLE